MKRLFIALTAILSASIVFSPAATNALAAGDPCKGYYDLHFKYKNKPHRTAQDERTAEMARQMGIACYEDQLLRRADERAKAHAVTTDMILLLFRRIGHTGGP